MPVQRDALGGRPLLADRLDLLEKAAAVP